MENYSAVHNFALISSVFRDYPFIYILSILISSLFIILIGCIFVRVLVCLLICYSLILCHITTFVIDLGVFYCSSYFIFTLYDVYYHCQIFGNVICFHYKRKGMSLAQFSPSLRRLFM